jgi:hypothetical protein
MIVSVDTRLASMISAMTGAVLPAVAGDAFAGEQAQLLAGHLQVLRAQAPFSDEFERLEHRHTRGLARDLTDAAEGGPRTVRSVEGLRALLDRGMPAEIADVRAAQHELTAGLEEFVAAEGDDGTEASVARSTRLITRAEYQQSLRDRSFFGPFGYEDSPDSVAPIPDMMAQFRSEFPEEQSS